MIKTTPIWRRGGLRARFALLAAAAVTAAVTAPWADAQSTDGTSPTNDLPSPYKSERPWGQLPGGRAWGALSAVGLDNDGKSVWVGDRCGPNPNTPPNVSAFLWDSCSNSTADPIHKLDSAGHVLLSFGSGMFIFPHKVTMDREGNVWVVDNRGPNERELKENPASAQRGNAVYKFSPQGRLLMTIGTPGKAGNPPDALTEPNAIVELPNGELLIAEGHSAQSSKSPDAVSRISRFTHDGKFIGTIGKLGAGPGEFRTPHDIILDGQGHLLVADRGNMRIQVLDLDGHFIREMKQWSRPSALAIRGDTLYVADSESNGVAPHPGWERGIRVGSYSTGVVKYRIPDIDNFKGTSSAEGIAVDAAGNIYAAEVGARQMVKHVPTE